MPLSSILCPVCHKVFSTSQAQRSHIAQAPGCMWYRIWEKSRIGIPALQPRTLIECISPAGTNPDLYPTIPIPVANDDDTIGGPVAADVDYQLVHDDDAANNPVPDFGEAGPGPSSARYARLDASMRGARPRHLEDAEDERVLDEYTSAGGISGRNPSLQQQWDTFLVRLKFMLVLGCPLSP